MDEIFKPNSEDLKLLEKLRAMSGDLSFDNTPLISESVLRAIEQRLNPKDSSKLSKFAYQSDDNPFNPPRDYFPRPTEIFSRTSGTQTTSTEPPFVAPYQRDGETFREWMERVQQERALWLESQDPFYIRWLRSIRRGAGNACSIGVKACSFLKEMLGKICGYVTTLFPGLSGAMSSLKDFLYRLAEPILKGVRLQFDSIQSYVFFIISVIIACLGLCLPETAVSSYGRIAYIVLAAMSLYAQSFIPISIVAGVTAFTYFLKPAGAINVSINNNNPIMSPQGPKEDLKEMIGNVVGISVLFLAGTKGIEVPTDGKSWENLMKRHTLLHKSYQAWDFCIDKLGEILESSFQLFCKYFLGTQYESFSRITEIEDLHDSVTQLLTLESQSIIGKDSQVAKKIEATYLEYLKLRRIYAGNRFVTQRLEIISAPLISLYKKIVDKNPHAHVMRKEPLCLVLSGDSGIGKSYLVSSLHQDLLKIAGVYDPAKDMDGMIYSRAAEQEYWDGYGGQPLCVYDDFGQQVDSLAKPNLEFYEIVRAVNIFPYLLHCAALHEKANTPFMADFICITTNLKNFKAASLISDTAFQRRLHLKYEVSLIPCVRKEIKIGNKTQYVLCTEKLDEYRETNNLPLFDKSHWTFRNNETGAYLSYDEMIIEISLEYRKKKENFETRKQVMQETSRHQLPAGAYTSDVRWRALSSRDVESEPIASTSFSPQAPEPLVPSVPLEPPSFVNFLAADPTLPEDRESAVERISQIYHSGTGHRVLLGVSAASFVGAMGSATQQIRQRFGDVMSGEFSRAWTAVMDLRSHFVTLFGGLIVVYQALRFTKSAILSVVSTISGIKSVVASLMSLFSSPLEGEESGVTVMQKESLEEQPKKQTAHPELKYGKRTYEQFLDYCKSTTSRIEQYVEWFKSFETPPTEEECLQKAAELKIIKQRVQVMAESAMRSQQIGQRHKFESEEDLVEKIGEIKKRIKKYIEFASKGPRTQEELDDEAIRLCIVNYIIDDVTFPVYVPTHEGADPAKESLLSVFESGRSSTDEKKKKGPSFEGVLSTQLECLAQRCLKCLWILETVEGETDETPLRVGTIFALKGRRALINYHFLQIVSHRYSKSADKSKFMLRFRQFSQQKGVLADPKKIIVSAENVKRGTNPTEFYMITLPLQCCAAPDMTKHLITSTEMSKLKAGVPMRVMTINKLQNTETLAIYHKDGPCQQVSTITMKDMMNPNITHIYPQSCSYSICTTNGDCGGPVFANSDMFARKLVGFHFSGDAGVGACSIITDSDVASMLTDEICSADPVQIELSVQSLKEFPLQEGSFFVLGKPLHKVSHPCKSSIQPSLINGFAGEPKCIPAILAPPLQPGGPMFRALSKNANENVPLTHEHVLDQVVRDYFTTCIQPFKALECERSVLTYEQACAGIDGNQFFPPLKRSKSAGYPFMCFNSNGKKDWLGTDEWDFSSEKSKELRREVDQMERMCKKNIIPEVYFVSTLKDEKRPREKVEAGKTRSFSACPMHYSILFRKYFLGFLAYSARNKISNECAVGTNAHGGDWGKIPAHLLAWDEQNLVAGDFENFDGGVHADIFNRICDIINDFYADGETNARVRRMLWQCITAPYHILSDFAFAFTHGQPSGNPSTAVTNSIYVSLAFRYCYMSTLIKDNKLYEGPANEEGAVSLQQAFLFKNHVRMITYGDDSVISISPQLARVVGIKFFSQSFQKFLNVNFTRADKSLFKEGDKFENISQVTFLKREFTYDSTRRHWYAPLDLTSIEEMCNWIKKSESPEQATIDNCSDALQELCHHPKSVFIEYKDKILQACKLQNLLLVSPQYDAVRESICLNEFKYYSDTHSWV